MAGQQREAQHLAGKLLQQVPHQPEVAQGFGHLLAVDIDVAVVHPVAHVLGAVGAAALGDFVLVVREDQILAAAVNIDHIAQMLVDHRRALDVPARPAAAPGRFPAGLVVAAGFPQHEIAGVALVVRHFHPGAGAHVFQIAAGQLAVVGHRLHREQHMAVRFIGVALGDQGFDHGGHLADMIGGLGHDVRLQGIERRHVLAEGVGEALGERGHRLAGFRAGGDDLVVDVGDVAGVDHLRVEPGEQPVEHVEHHHRPRVADVHVVIDRRAAHIECYPLRVERLERVLVAGEGVMQCQHAGPSVVIKVLGIDKR